MTYPATLKLEENQMTYPAILHVRPDGRQIAFEVVNISPRAEAIFRARKVKLSFEDSPVGPITYIDSGLRDEEGEPIEHIIFAAGRSCMEVLDEAADMLEEFE